MTERLKYSFGDLLVLAPMHGREDRFLSFRDIRIRYKLAVISHLRQEKKVLAISATIRFRCYCYHAIFIVVSLSAVFSDFSIYCCLFICSLQILIEGVVGGYLGDIAVSDPVLSVNGSCSYLPEEARPLKNGMFVAGLFYRLPIPYFQKDV